MTELPAPQVRFGGPTAIIVPPDNGFKGPPQGERAGQCRKGHLPRKRSDARIAVNRRARSGELGGKSEIWRVGRSHRGGSDGDGGGGTRKSIPCYSAPDAEERSRTRRTAKASRHQHTTRER